MSSNQSGKLTIEHLGELHNLLAPVAYAYKRFGSQIKVKNDKLLGFEQTSCDCSDKLYKVLEHRLRQLPPLTWHDIVRALKSPAVQEEVLASEIESQYIPCSSSQAQLASSQSSTKHLDSETKSQQDDRIMHRKRRHSPPHEKSCKRPRKARKPKRACKEYAKQPLLSKPHSKPLVNMSSNAERLNSNSWSEGLLGDFIKYQKSLYRSRAVENRKKVLKLLNPGNVFIPLEFIDRKTKGLRLEYDEITEAIVRDGNVDVIEGRKCPIDMNEIAANLPEETLEKIILVEGAPGVGKSAFAWEFCRRWGRGEIAQQYDLVLLIPLSNDRISKAQCWKDFIYHSSPRILQAVISELEARSGLGVLFILEGYDELPNKCRNPSSPFLKLISGDDLPLATLIITSRPWATRDVLKEFKPRIFQHIEILGFTKTQISSYIQNVLPKEEVEDFEKKLLKHDQIRKCMYIPSNCAIVVTVFQDRKASGNNMPSTMTELYLALSHTILLRYLRANDPYSDPIECFEELPHHVLEKFKYLCELAYSGVAEAGDKVRLIFSGLPRDFDGLGFTDLAFELYETQKEVSSRNFLHLTLQEFLAAVHISNMEAEQRLEHFKRHKEGKLRVVLRFLAGITKLKEFSTPSSFAGLLDQPRKCGYTAIDYTIRPHVCTWVYEARGKEIIKTIFHENVTVEFACYELTDPAALGYCITHSCCKWVLSVWGRMTEEEIDILVDESQTSDSTGGVIVGLRGVIFEEKNTILPLEVSLEGLHKIFAGLCIHLNELALAVPSKCSDISWPDLSSLQSLTLYMNGNETINWQLDYLLLLHLSLSSLALSISPTFSLEDIKAVANYISKTSTLKDVHISGYFSVTIMDKIFAAMVEKESQPFFSLEILDREIDNNNAVKLANYIRTTVLSKLVFPFLTFSAFGALQVARALREVPDLIADKLYCFLYEPSDFIHAIELIEYFDLVDETAEDYNISFSFLLPDSTTVYLRFKVGDDIHDVGLQHIAEALLNTSSIKTLELYSIVSYVGAKALAEALKWNTTLEELDLSHNEIGNIGTEALTQAIGLNTTLKKLVLSENNVGVVETKALAEALNSNTILEELDLSENEIESIGTEALAQAIGSNTTLKKLVLSNNFVGDVGTKALAEALNSNTILEELDLLGNEIGNIGTEALAQAIGSNITLKKLDLSYNDVGDVGARALAEVLKCNTILEELDLSSNEISNGGSEALAQAIRSNTALKKLVLQSNGIGDAGAEALAQAIRSNTALKKLDLSHNHVGDVGAIALAQALHSNSCLEVLDLSRNHNGDSVAKALAKALHHNSTIIHLHLSYKKSIGEEGIRHLIHALTVNNSISENGLTLDREGSECALNCSGYRNVEHKIKWR